MLCVLLVLSVSASSCIEGTRTLIVVCYNLNIEVLQISLNESFSLFDVCHLNFYEAERLVLAQLHV